MALGAEGVHIWLVLWKASRAVERCAAKSIESLELCVSDFAVLEALLHKGPLPVNTVGKKVLLTSGSMTTAIDRLETKGLVERKNDPIDRRARIVHLTARGRRLILKAFNDHAADMDRLVAGLEPTERTTIVRLLKKLGLAAERTLTPDGSEDSSGWPDSMDKEGERR
ncbi:MAG TPA: MarR family winged helix-turn-helix transcriptional regulator [Blastocatellia bacterium]|nr:MarR family winged helix-turn-helix transcriptional regulator [Blastocatellia bacterium]